MNPAWSSRAFLQAVSWIFIAIPSPSNILFFKIILFLLGNFGASIVEVANDAIVAETGKQPSAEFGLCPPGCEGSLMAFLTSSIALAFIVSGYLGVALASYVGVTGNDFSGLSRGLIVQAACTLLPLFWSSCIPDVPKTKRKGQ
ncbi:putative folate-biopterin transporter 7 [Camellia lanceoleosa]|uniref:Folate-biopterin transporter 7 n=1 Tax=Camellia lanceoleosa TaxID=1840588 RepID=A0ACC0I0M6_9ERIC|nr:putative folate-biopterin transporter 7 [Camellia lanceoleosa]